MSSTVQTSVKDRSPGDDCQFADPPPVSLQCGQPALVSSKIILTTEVKNKMKEGSLRQYYFSNHPLCQVILENKSDYEVSTACDELMFPLELVNNAATALGSDYDSVSVSCRPGPSAARPHPPCEHGPVAKLPDRKEKDKAEDKKDKKRTVVVKEGLIDIDKVQIQGKIDSEDKEHKKLFRCTVCGHMERTLDFLLKHVRTVHYDSPPMAEKPSEPPKLIKRNCSSCSRSHILGKYSCRNCSFTTSCPFVLESHMKQSHASDQIYHCPCCNHKNRYYTAMETHLFEKHFNKNSDNQLKDTATKTKKPDDDTKVDDGDNEMDVECDFNELGDSVVGSMRVEDEPLLCVCCRARFRSVDLLRTHITKDHIICDGTRISFYCCLCPLMFASFVRLCSHYETSHSDDNVFFREATRCEHWPSQLVDRITSQINRDYLYNLDKETYRLSLRSGILIKIYRRERLQKRLQERKCMDQVNCLLSCQICGYGPCGRGQMVSHLCRHTQRWPFSCPGCMQWFKEKSSALEHAKSCTEGSQTQTASRVVIRMEDLRKQNEQIVAMLLDQCDVKFLGSRVEFRGLEDIALFYSVAELWCDICKHNCWSFMDMHDHMFDHIDIKTYRCTGCGEVFSSRRLTQAHINRVGCNGTIHFDKILDIVAQDKALAKANDNVTLVEFIVSTNDSKFELQQRLDANLAMGQLPRVPTKTSKDSTKTSKDSTKTSKDSTKTSKDATKTSKDSAKTSKDSAKTSKDSTSAEADSSKLVAYQCLLCRCTFPAVSAFKLHAADHFSFTPWKCRVCWKSFKVFTGESGFYNHARKEHNSDPIQCKIVNMEDFRNQEEGMKRLLQRVELPLGEVDSMPTKVVHPRQEELMKQSDKLQDSPTKRVDKRKQSMGAYTYQEQGNRGKKLEATEPPLLKKSRLAKILPKPRTSRESFTKHVRADFEEMDEEVDTIIDESQSGQSSGHSAGQTAGYSAGQSSGHSSSVKSGSKSLKSQKFGVVDGVKISKMAIATFVCPQCQDFDGVWSDLVLHYEAMHSDMAVCVKCENSPCLHIVDYYKHMTQYHPGFKVSDISARRTDSKILARDLVEQLGVISREKYGSLPTTSVVKSKMIKVTMAPESGLGLASARFVCKQCSLTTRRAESFFEHIGFHLNIGEFHCLHCPFEATVAKMREHYKDNHHIKMPELLPYSLQHKRFRKLVDKIMFRLGHDGDDGSGDVREKTGEKDDKTGKSGKAEDKCKEARKPAVKIKSEPKDDYDYGVPKVGACIKSEVEMPDSPENPEQEEWTFTFACAYCDYEVDRISAYKVHVDLTHPRHQLAIGVDLSLTLPEVDALAIAAKVQVTVSTTPRAGSRRDRIEQISLSSSVDDAPRYCSIPAGFTMRDMTTTEFIQHYNAAMLGLYNHFSIMEAVMVVGDKMVCHVCGVAQETFPALFEHWNRHHLNIEPYLCAFCGVNAKRPTTIISHERRAHPKDCGSKYVISTALFNELFSVLQTLLKEWLVKNNVDSFIPEDIKLIKEPVVLLDDIRKNPRYKKYFVPRATSPASSVTSSVTSSRSTRLSRRKP